MSTSNNMPLESYSILQPSTNASSYNGSQESIIRWELPSSLGYVDHHTSYLRLSMELKNTNYKMSFTNDCGSLNLIQYLRISQNGNTIEEIFDAHILANVLKCYSESHSVRQRRAVQDYASYNNNNSNSTYGEGDADNQLSVPPLNGIGTSENAMNRTIDLILYLNYSGFLTTKSVMPYLALGNVMIEIKLNAPSRCLRVFPPTKNTFNVCGGTFDNSAQTWNGLTTGFTETFLRPPFRGFACLGDSPFAVGMSIEHFDAGVSKGEVVISAIEESNNGLIKITHSAVAHTIAVDDATIKITKGLDGNASPVQNTDYEITRSDWFMAIVKPPPQYTEQIAKQVQGEGLIMDIPTYRTYTNPIMKEVSSQSFQIPSFMSRVKGIITVPVDGQQDLEYKVDNSKDYQSAGQFENLKSYQHQSDNLFYPTQPVLLDSFLGNGTYSTKASSEHIHQVDQTLHSCDMDFRTLTNVKSNFIIPRAFSKYNATTNLTGTGARLYLQYNDVNSPAKNLTANSYACSNTRMVIGENGVEVFV